MKLLWLCVVATAVASPTFGITVAHATAPVPVTIGATWDGPSQGLQGVVDAYLGVPGAINVQTDFVGARPGDLDPWFWVGSGFPAVIVTEIASNANTNELGWYREMLVKPAIDGVDDGVVFTGTETDGASALVTFPAGTSKFGFYLKTHVVVTTPTGPQDQVFFTNRFSNDLGASGFGATHAPFDGDMQALVFDVSAWKGPGTWLVCFEDTDAGLPVQACCTGTDDDYNDIVFLITALGATPAAPSTFGALKTRYR
jgi:hypothetical protein